jgi:hypothetical protein
MGQGVMKLTRTFAPLIAALSVAGCMATAGTPDTEALAKADDPGVRAKNMPDNYRQLVAADLHKTLKDPRSIQDAEISPPLKNSSEGTSVCVRLNAKNSYGGYTGIKSYTFFFRDKALSDYHLAGNIDGIGDTAEVFCKGNQFGPFPEVMRKG